MGYVVGDKDCSPIQRDEKVKRIGGTLKKPLLSQPAVRIRPSSRGPHVSQLLQVLPRIKNGREWGAEAKLTARGGMREKNIGGLF